MRPSSQTTFARYSRFTWCTMPVAGGTTRKFRSADWPHLRNSYRSRFRSNSSRLLIESATPELNASTCTEWSITRSHGTSGLTFAGSPPRATIASRIAARSTTHGTPVKSCSTTRPGMKAISRSPTRFASNAASERTCSSVTTRPSQFLRHASSRTLIPMGSRAMSPCSRSASMRKTSRSPRAVERRSRAAENGWADMSRES